MIDLFKVHMPPNVEQELSTVLRSGYIAEGVKVKEFENLFAKYIGNQNTLMVNSCTSAITLSLIAAGVVPGDEVIATPMTCMATNLPIHTLGAKIVWADIDPKTGNIDPTSIIKNISKKTKAIIYVHWAGEPSDITAITKIANKHGLKVIEDAAHALGSEYAGKKIGNHGDFVCFSFQAIKHITTGDGGAICLNNCKSQKVLDLIRKMRWYGLDRHISTSTDKWKQDIDVVGFKMNMNDITATLGIAQMDHVENIIHMHQKNCEYYDAELMSADGITLTERNSQSHTAAWIYTLLLDSDQERQKFIAHLNSHDIACSVVHVRNDEYSIFQQYKTKLPGVDEFCSRMINIPCGWWVTTKDREHIAKIIREEW